MADSPEPKGFLKQEVQGGETQSLPSNSESWRATVKEEPPEGIAEEIPGSADGMTVGCASIYETASEVKEEWLEDVKWKIDDESAGEGGDFLNCSNMQQAHNGDPLVVSVSAGGNLPWPEEDIQKICESPDGSLITYRITNFELENLGNEAAVTTTKHCPVENVVRFTRVHKSQNKSSLRRHMRSHSEEKPFVCDVCKYRCQNACNLEKHMKIHTKENSEYSVGKGRSSGEVSSLMKAKEKLFACDICEYRCEYPSGLMRHTTSHSIERPFACNVCDYRSTRADMLKYHLRTHSGDKPFACNFCDYRSIRAFEMKEHIMRIHTEERPFACDFCEYRSTRAQPLKIHMRKHTGEKPFACNQCDYRSIVAWNLKVHMKTHAVEKPFACDVCDYSCIRAYQLKNHMKKHTGEKPSIIIIHV